MRVFGAEAADAFYEEPGQQDANRWRRSVRRKATRRPFRGAAHLSTVAMLLVSAQARTDAAGSAQRLLTRPSLVSLFSCPAQTQQVRVVKRRAH
jgi:hypothetical protein